MVGRIRINPVMKKVRKFLIKYWWVGLLILFFSLFAKSLLFVLFVLIGGINPIYKRFVHFPLGLDLTTFITVLLFFSYGTFWTFLGIFFMLVIGAFSSAEFNHVPLSRLVKYVVVILCCAVFSGLGIVVAGKIATVLGLMLMLVTGFILRGPLVLRAIPAFFIGIFLNFFLLDRFGVILLKVLEAL